MPVANMLPLWAETNSAPEYERGSKDQEGERRVHLQNMPVSAMLGVWHGHARVTQTHVEEKTAGPWKPVDVPDMHSQRADRRWPMRRAVSGLLVVWHRNERFTKTPVEETPARPWERVDLPDMHSPRVARS